MSDQGNIFLTYENLAFSLPLILVISSYVVYTYVPPYITFAVFAFLFVVYQIRSQLIALREKKLQNLDESAIKDLLDDEDEATKNDGKKKTKGKKKVQQRPTRQTDTAADEDEDIDDDDLVKFAKGSRQKNKKQ